MTARVVAIASDSKHNFSKPVQDVISLIAGEGVVGDAHRGVTVQHLYDKKKTPNAPNLRQVHLMHSELFLDLKAQGISVTAGQMGENITTQGVDILNLPLHTILEIGDKVRLQVTGLRNPCRKLNAIDSGLLKALVQKDTGGAKVKSGIMSIVLTGGDVRSGDVIKIIHPEGDPAPLPTL